MLNQFKYNPNKIFVISEFKMKHRNLKIKELVEEKYVRPVEVIYNMGRAFGKTIGYKYLIQDKNGNTKISL